MPDENNVFIPFTYEKIRQTVLVTGRSIGYNQTVIMKKERAKNGQNF